MEWDKVNGDNDDHFRKVVVWLEDQKIRHYAIDDRKSLRDTRNENWFDVFRGYCKDVCCPINDNDKFGQLEWLTGHAFWLDTGTDYDRYRAVAEKKIKLKKEAAAPTMKSTNPLDKLDFYDIKFVAGTAAVSSFFKIPKHPDHLGSIQAACKLVRSRLNEVNLRNPVIHRGASFPALDTRSGFDARNDKVERAARALALLYIQELRELQTQINESIVAVQAITANPKTDTRLGKIGK